jgi:hypothetical protein
MEGAVEDVSSFLAASCAGDNRPIAGHSGATKTTFLALNFPRRHPSAATAGVQHHDARHWDIPGVKSRLVEPPMDFPP